MLYQRLAWRCSLLRGREEKRVCLAEPQAPTIAEKEPPPPPLKRRFVKGGGLFFMFRLLWSGPRRSEPRVVRLSHTAAGISLPVRTTGAGGTRQGTAKASRQLPCLAAVLFRRSWREEDLVSRGIYFERRSEFTEVLLSGGGGEGGNSYGRAMVATAGGKR